MPETKQPASDEVEVVTNRYVYHTPGRVPHAIGAIIKLARHEAARLRHLGFVRLRDDPVPGSAAVQSEPRPTIAPPPPAAPDAVKTEPKTEDKP